jgi:DNA-binding IclR family transcriptional regulator
MSTPEDRSAATSEDGRRPATSDSSVLVLEKGVRIVDCFTPQRPHLSMGDLRRLTGMPASTVARLVRTLVSLDLLEKVDDHYRIGLRVLGWTGSATAGSGFIESATREAARLRDLTGETAGLFIPRGTTRVAVVVKLAKRSIICSWHVGQLLPMHSGAGGKVFIAHDDHLLSAVLVGANGGAGIQLTPQLEAQLSLAREQGWILAEQEREVGLSSVAAPVFDATGHVIATLGIGGPSFRVNQQTVRELGPMVAEVASSISKDRGHDTPSLRST